MNKGPKLLLFLAVFLLIYGWPLEDLLLPTPLLEALYMLQEYAREHVIFCLIPAFFIAGAMANFISQRAVIQYFGGGANKVLSYAIASVSGTILAVCSCTVLPLFTGIYRRGAGIGPATAFLYSGPAINILAIILTTRVLGWSLGLARGVGAVLFSLVIGLIMAALFKGEEEKRLKGGLTAAMEEEGGRSPLQNFLFFLVLVLILISAAWSPPETAVGFWSWLYGVKWPLTIILLLILGLFLHRFFHQEEMLDWLDSTWDFAQQILPLLLVGVLVAGFFMGRPGLEGGIIPAGWVASLVGGESLGANLTASLIGALMYFATLTEVPILQGLLGLGMGSGPALALLLAGPALSLPNILVIHGVLGPQKTAVFVILVVIMSTGSGMIYGYFMTRF